MTSSDEGYTPASLEALVPTYIGPTWKRDEAGQFILPALTLGWEIAGWCHAYILDPNCDEDDPQPWEFTLEQLRFVLWWYEIDKTGRFVSRTGVLQRLKGWGKDPLLAVLCLVEMVGPSRFSHFDATGFPIGKIHPAAWVQVVSSSQPATVTTFEMFPRLMSKQLIADYDFEPGKELIRARGGRCRIVAVTANYRTLEGARTTFTVLGETQHWVKANGGLKMYATIGSNAAKGSNRFLAITNAYLPGEDSVAELMRRAHTDIVEGRGYEVGFLYDSVEANPKTPLTPEGIMAAIPLIRGDSIWLDPLNIIAEIMKTDVSPARSRRMWLNQIVADEDALFEEDDWDDLRQVGERLSPHDEIVLGFDGGKSDDATALVAIRVRDTFVQPLLIEERPNGLDYWEVNREKVDSAVHAAFQRFKVRAFFADVSLWESYIAQWSARYGPQLEVKGPDQGGNAIGWDMRGATKRVTMANELLMQTILDGNIAHGDETDPLNVTLRRHLLNARRRENGYGVSFGKEGRESPKKVDGYAALMVAYAALNDLRQKVTTKSRTGNAWFF